MLTEASPTKHYLPIPTDVTKRQNELLRDTHDDHWDDDAPAHCEEIVSKQEPCEDTRALTDINSPRIKAVLRQGSSDSRHRNEGHTVEPKNR